MWEEWHTHGSIFWPPGEMRAPTKYPLLSTKHLETGLHMGWAKAG